MLYEVQVTWGRRLGLAVQDWEEAKKGRNRTALFEVVGELTKDASPQTISKLLKRTEPPERLNDQIRAVVLLICLGETIEDYEVAEAVLPRHLNRSIIESTLRSHSATWNCVSPHATHVAA